MNRLYEIQYHSNISTPKSSKSNRSRISYLENVTKESKAYFLKEVFEGPNCPFLDLSDDLINEIKKNERRELSVESIARCVLYIIYLACFISKISISYI